MAGSLLASACPPVTQISSGISTYDRRCAHSLQFFSCPSFLQKKHEPAFRFFRVNAGARGASGARRSETCLPSLSLTTSGCRLLNLRRFRVNAVGDMPDPSKDGSGEDAGDGRVKRQLEEGKSISMNQSSDEADLDRWSGKQSGEESSPVINQDGAGISNDARGSSEAEATEGSELDDDEDAQTKRVLDILHKREEAPSQTPARSLRERFGGFRVSGPQVPMTLQPQNPIKPRKRVEVKSEDTPEKDAEESGVAGESVAAEGSVKSMQEAEESAELTPETESSAAEERLNVGDVSADDAPVESSSATVQSGAESLDSVEASESESSNSEGPSKADTSEPVKSVEATFAEVEADLPEADSEDDSEGEEEVAGGRSTIEERAVKDLLPEVPNEDIPIPPSTPEDERLRAAFEETLLSDWKVEGLEGELQLYVTKIKALEEFEKELARPDDDIDLVRTSALIAQHAYPDCTPEDCESQLRFLAEELKESLPPPSERYPLRMIKAINKFLFEKEGFKGSWGSDRDMYSPKLLCINKVLANKSGMPILMSVVYLELARRVGFPMVGVNLPLHFVIRPMATDCEFLVDAHDGGKLMFLEDVQEKLASVFKAKVVVNPDFISNTPAVPKRTILLRILNNLKRKYFSNRNYSECLAIIEYMKRVQPPTEEPGLYRDEGLCLFALRRTKEATESIDAYLTAAPDALDADAMRDLLQKIREGGLN